MKHIKQVTKEAHMPLLFAITVFVVVVVVLALLGIGAALKGVDSRPELGDQRRFPEHHNSVGGSF